MALVDFFEEDDLEDVQSRHQCLSDLGCPSPDQKRRRDALKAVLDNAGKGTKVSNLCGFNNRGKQAPPKVIGRA